MSFNLSAGAIEAIVSGNQYDSPVFQIIDSKLVNSRSGKDRYRLLLSDGRHTYSHVMLATQLNPMLQTGEMDNHCLVRCKKYICNTVLGDRRVLVLLEVEVLANGWYMASRIGNPQPYLQGLVSDQAQPAPGGRIDNPQSFALVTGQEPAQPAPGGRISNPQPVIRVSDEDPAKPAPGGRISNPQLVMRGSVSDKVPAQPAAPGGRISNPQPVIRGPVLDKVPAQPAPGGRISNPQPVIRGSVSDQAPGQPAPSGRISNPQPVIRGSVSDQAPGQPAPSGRISNPQPVIRGSDKVPAQPAPGSRISNPQSVIRGSVSDQAPGQPAPGGRISNPQPVIRGSVSDQAPGQPAPSGRISNPQPIIRGSVSDQAPGQPAPSGRISNPQPVIRGSVSDQAPGQPAPNFTTAMSTCLIVQDVPAMKMDEVRKCKDFFNTLIKFSARVPDSNLITVLDHIQRLIDGNLEPEKFEEEIRGQLKSSPQPLLVPLLKKSLPLLREELFNNKMSIPGIRRPPAQMVRRHPVPPRASPVSHTSTNSQLDKHTIYSTTTQSELASSGTSCTSSATSWASSASSCTSSATSWASSASSCTSSVTSCTSSAALGTSSARLHMSSETSGTSSATSCMSSGTSSATSRTSTATSRTSSATSCESSATSCTSSATSCTSSAGKTNPSGTSLISPRKEEKATELPMNISMPAVSSHNLHEHLMCAICLDLYTEPVRLNCMHCFCRKCITDHTIKGVNSIPSCPECNSTILTKEIGSLKTDFKLKELVSAIRDKPLCSDHDAQDERIAELICKTCHVTLCTKCAFGGQHMAHVLDDLQTAVYKYHSEMSTKMPNIKEKLDGYRTQIVEVHRYSTVLQDIQHSTEAEFNRLIEDLQDKVRKIQAEGLEEISDSFNMVKGELGKKEETLSTNIRNGEDFMKWHSTLNTDPANSIKCMANADGYLENDPVDIEEPDRAAILDNCPSLATQLRQLKHMVESCQQFMQPSHGGANTGKFPAKRKTDAVSTTRTFQVPGKRVKLDETIGTEKLTENGVDHSPSGDNKEKGPFSGEHGRPSGQGDNKEKGLFSGELNLEDINFNQISPPPKLVRLTAKIVRVGTLSRVPLGPIIMSLEGLYFCMKGVTDTLYFNICPNEIKQCLISIALDRDITLIFLLTTHGCAARMRKDLGMAVYLDPSKPPLEPYFDPAHKEMRYQMISIIMEQLSPQSRLEFLQYMEMFKLMCKPKDDDFICKLSSREAHEIFRQTTSALDHTSAVATSKASDEDQQ